MIRLGLIDDNIKPSQVPRLQRWAFKAIYTPGQTEFSRAAEAAGLALLGGGYELFIHQGWMHSSSSLAVRWTRPHCAALLECGS